MRITPLEIEIERGSFGRTLFIILLNIDLDHSNSSLLEIGIYQGGFRFEIFFWRYIRYTLIERFLDRLGE
ncbi:MAG: hypothetical protein GY853_01680 [PVC group bacterium]|nr:hypothetical protein [PVC group bacterium]